MPLATIQASSRHWSHWSNSLSNIILPIMPASVWFILSTMSLLCGLWLVECFHLAPILLKYACVYSALKLLPRSDTTTSGTSKEQTTFLNRNSHAVSAVNAHVAPAMTHSVIQCTARRCTCFLLWFLAVRPLHRFRPRRKVSRVWPLLFQA